MDETVFDADTLTQMTVWGAILLAGIVSYGLRVFPVLFHRQDKTATKPHPFFEYASYSLIGGIIATSALGRHLRGVLMGAVSSSFWIVLAALLVTFGVAVKSKRSVLSLGIGIGFYALLKALLG